MTPMRSKLRLTILVVGILVLAAIVAAVGTRLAARNKTTAVGVEQATQRFNEVASTSSAASTATSGSTAAPSLTPVTAEAAAAAPVLTTTSTPPTTVARVPVAPAPGVYVYRTTGGDSIDALGGDRHDYPAETTVTVLTTACGVTQRWDIAVERWQQWERCIDGNVVRQPSQVNFAQFFGQSQTDTLGCDSGARPVDAPAGFEWRQRCTNGGRVFLMNGVVIGPEEMKVGETPVMTTHVRVTIDSGNPADNQRTDTWYRLGTDLVVAQSGIADTSNDTFAGKIHYHEEYSIHLTSLTPRT